IETIATPWGPIRVKVAETADGARAIPEYDDCRAAASKHALPLVEIIDRVTRLYYDQNPGSNRKRG
ncbi:MAG TPA: nickel insertion protein, partial [bacterium]|nr:nickel insertion protein [bacterium]